eukprot:31308-Pelagococcus_subviridis.AAC.2
MGPITRSLSYYYSLRRERVRPSETQTDDGHRARRSPTPAGGVSRRFIARPSLSVVSSRLAVSRGSRSVDRLRPDRRPVRLAGLRERGERVHVVRPPHAASSSKTAVVVGLSKPALAERLPHLPYPPVLHVLAHHLRLPVVAVHHERHRVPVLPLHRHVVAPRARLDLVLHEPLELGEALQSSARTADEDRARAGGGGDVRGAEGSRGVRGGGRGRDRDQEEPEERREDARGGRRHRATTTVRREKTHAHAHAGGFHPSQLLIGSCDEKNPFGIFDRITPDRGPRY